MTVKFTSKVDIILFVIPTPVNSPFGYPFSFIVYMWIVGVPNIYTKKVGMPPSGTRKLK